MSLLFCGLSTQCFPPLVSHTQTNSLLRFGCLTLFLRESKGAKVIAHTNHGITEGTNNSNKRLARLPLRLLACFLSLLGMQAKRQIALLCPAPTAKQQQEGKAAEGDRKKKKTSQELERSKVRRTNKQKEKKNAESHAFLSFTWLIFGGYIQICHIFRQKGRGGWCVETHLNPDKSTTTCQH